LPDAEAGVGLDPALRLTQALLHLADRAPQLAKALLHLPGRCPRLGRNRLTCRHGRLPSLITPMLHLRTPRKMAQRATRARAHSPTRAIAASDSGSSGANACQTWIMSSQISRSTGTPAARARAVRRVASSSNVSAVPTCTS